MADPSAKAPDPAETERGATASPADDSQPTKWPRPKRRSRRRTRPLSGHDAR